MPRRLDRNFRCQPGFHHSMTKASWSPTLAGRPRRRAWASTIPPPSRSASHRHPGRPAPSVCSSPHFLAHGASEVASAPPELSSRSALIAPMGGFRRLVLPLSAIARRRLGGWNRVMEKVARVEGLEVALARMPAVGHAIRARGAFAIRLHSEVTLRSMIVT